MVWLKGLLYATISMVAMLASFVKMARSTGVATVILNIIAYISTLTGLIVLFLNWEFYSVGIAVSCLVVWTVLAIAQHAIQPKFKDVIPPGSLDPIVNAKLYSEAVMHSALVFAWSPIGMTLTLLNMAVNLFMGTYLIMQIGWQGWLGLMIVLSNIGTFISNWRPRPG